MPSINPLLADAPLPLFDQIRAEHVEPALRELLSAQRDKIQAIEHLENPTFASVVVPLEMLRHRLSRVWSPVGHLNGVLNSEPLRTAYNACLPLLSEYYTDLSQSEPLYRAYQHILAREGGTLDAVQRALLERSLRDFRLAGVALDAPRKQRFKALMVELTQLQAQFEEHVLDATNAFRYAVTDPQAVRGVNESILAQAAQRAREQGLGGWLFTLDQPTYVAIQTDAESGDLRRVFYEAWSTRASDRGPSAPRFDNGAVIEQILRCRHELARLLDFPSFADYALADLSLIHI